MSILIDLPTFTRKGYADKVTAERIGRQLAQQYKGIASNVTIKQTSKIEWNELHVWQVIRIELKNGKWAKFAVTASGRLAFTWKDTSSEGGKLRCKTADELIAKLQTL